MKFFYVFLFIAFSYIFSLYISTNTQEKIMYHHDNKDKHLSKPSIIVNKILDETSLYVEKKYKIQTVGKGVSMPGGTVKKLSLSFNSYENLSKDQLRKITLDFIEKLLNNINSNSDIQPFLVKRPFTIENVSFFIANYDSKGYQLNDPEIGYSYYSNGKLVYKTYDPEKEFGYKNEFEETYEEALQLVQKGNQNQKNMVK